MEARLPLIILIGLLVFTFCFHSTAATTIGGSLKKDLSSESLWYGGFLRTGGLLKLELGGYKPYSGPASEIKLSSYLLLDLNLGSFGLENGSMHLYLGASPDMTLNTASRSFSVSSSAAYAKTGLQLNFFPFFVQVQTTGRLKFSGDLTDLFGSVGIGLTF